MCQIIWDSQFVHNAHILSVRMQHYSETVSFQEIQCSREVNIYLHNLTLLSDCLIFPVIFPSSFTPPPSSASKHLVQKRRDFPRGFGSQWSWWCNVCSPLSLGAPQICSFTLPHCFCSPSVCITCKSASNTCAGYLRLFLLPHPQWAGLVLLHPTSPQLHFLLLLFLLLSVSPPAQLSAASPKETLSCLPLCYLKTACPPRLPLNTGTSVTFGTMNESSWSGIPTSHCWHSWKSHAFSFPSPPSSFSLRPHKIAAIRSSEMNRNNNHWYVLFSRFE